jgi:hypothetical protein
MKNDRNANFDIYTQLKKEDSKFGEKSGKQTAKDHQKRTKSAGQTNYRNMRVSDILAMSDDYEEEGEFA